ncbi:hypothetical protein LEN26_019190 [Aphanomyces euteiches]|nr:hypothetical protein LEN26_019190 [Aphanomyces euteiches]
METCKEFRVEEKTMTSFGDVMWSPGATTLLGLDKMQRLLLAGTSETKQSAFEYVPPLFMPQSINIELDPNAALDASFLDALLFRRRTAFLDTITQASDTPFTTDPLSRHHGSRVTVTMTQEKDNWNLHNPTSLFSKDPVQLDVEEDVYVSQSIIFSLLLGSALSDEQRATLQESLLVHVRFLLEALVRRLDYRRSLDNLSHLVYATLYGGLDALLHSNDTTFATRLALEMLPLLQKVNKALEPIAESLVHADRQEIHPVKASSSHTKRRADDVPSSSSIVAARIPLKRQRTLYREPEVHMHFAHAIKTMLDNVHSAITGSSTDIINPTNLLNWEQSDSTSTSLMAYFDLSFKAANELVRVSKRHSFSSILVFVAEHPTQLPLIQIEMEIDCVKTSMSLLLDLQRIIISVQHHDDEPVQVLDQDLQQKLMRWKGATTVLLSLGWTVNTTGWHHLEYLAGAPHKLHEASQLISKYILICENCLQHLGQTHQVLLMQTNEAAAISKQLPPRLEFYCPLTHQLYTSSVELTRHANNLEPWLKCMVYSRMKKLFWYSPYSAQPQGNLHYPSYSSCRLEVQAAPDLLWVRHPFYLYHECLRHLISDKKSQIFSDDFLYVLPQVHGQVHFAYAEVYPPEMPLIHSLVQFHPENHEVTIPLNAFIQDLVKGRDVEWLQRLGPIQSKSPERATLERKILALILVTTGLLPIAVANSDNPAWNQLRKEFQGFRQWLHQQIQQSGSTLENLHNWVASKSFFYPLPLPLMLSPETALQPESYWRVEGIFRYVLHELGYLHNLEHSYPMFSSVAGFSEPSSVTAFEHGVQSRSVNSTSLSPSRILTRENLKQIAALDNDSSSPAELAKLVDMGFSLGLSSYVLKYYPHNVQGACQWLLNESNVDDMHRISVLQPRNEYGTPSTAHFRMSSDVKESLLHSCSTSRELMHVLRIVPRECFVPSLYEKEILIDSPIAHPLGYTLPSMHQCVQVLEALSLEPGLRILDIGTGSGYFVTLLARLMGDSASITSWEQDINRLAYAYVYMAQSVQDGHNVIYPSFMESIRFRVCNAFLNDQEGVKFDRVHVGASCPRESVDLLLQYVDFNGLLVVPLDGTLYRIHKTQNSNDWRTLPVEALGPYSIESLTAPSLEVLSRAPGQGMHGFEEQSQTKIPRVLSLDEEVAKESRQYPIDVGTMFRVKPTTTSNEVRQGRSDAGLVTTRVGTMPVQLKELSMGVKISEGSRRVSNRGSFGTACANVSVRGGGAWFYEVRIGTSKVIQIGWVLPGFDPNPESGLGVGDDSYSYAYDGRRKKKWHNGVSDDYCKQACKAGDIVGCLLDLDQGVMSFLLNGTQLGIAYSDLPRDFAMGGYTPACSMDGGESVWFNFGLKPFMYPPSHPFCPLSDFQYPPLENIPRNLTAILVARRINTDTVTATNVEDSSNVYHIPYSMIVPVDYHLKSILGTCEGPRSNVCMDLQHDLRIALARSFLASYQAHLAPHELAAYLSLASEFPQLDTNKHYKVSDSQLPWVVDSMQRQLVSAAESLIVEESKHPISRRLMSLTPTVIGAFKLLRSNLLDLEVCMEKGNSRGALDLLQRSIESILNRTELESGDHFQRCRSQLDATYQRIRSASSDYSFSDPSNYDRRPTLEKVAHLKQALELFESQVSFPSRVPVEAIHGKYVGLSEALSLKIEFDPRTLRTNWKLLFFADAACTHRWPWVLSRDGFEPFIIPANHFYYSFIPDTSKIHFVPEWGYAFRVTPYIFHPQKALLGWSEWSLVQKQPILQDRLMQSDEAVSWLHSILRYVRTPAAPEKPLVLSVLVQCIHRNRNRLRRDLQPILSQFLWYLQPELNYLYRTSVKWKLHSNPYFQTLLQTLTTLSNVVENKIQRYGVHVFGYHADLHMWHHELMETINGLDVMLPSTWQPIIAQQYNHLHMLKQLFKQFEASIKSDVQRWHKNRREFWIRQVDQAYHPALLSHSLCVFNETLLPGSRECGWSSERNKWLRHLQAACTVGDIAMQLMVLAGFIDVDSHSSSWSCQSYDWRKAVMSLTRTDLSEDGQLHVAAQWTDGNVVLDNDTGPVINRMFEDTTKLFRVRQTENVHVIGAFEYKRSLIRKIQFRLRKTYTNNNTPCTAGMVFVFPYYPSSEDMMKIQHYDHFTSEKYQAYVMNMRRRGMLPLPGDPVAFFDVTSPHYCQGNSVTVVPDFAILGQYVVVKLLKCYNFRVMEDLADVIKRQEERTPDVYFNMNQSYLWCYKPYEEWLIYPSDVEYMIETKYQAYCSGDIVCHGEFTVAGQDVVLDFQQMLQYTQTEHYSNPITCRIKRVLVTSDMKSKLTAHHCMEVEFMGFYGLQEAIAEEAYNAWKLKYQTVCNSSQKSSALSSSTELYRVLNEKSPVYTFPCLNSPILTYVLYGEIVSISKRMGRWGCIANSEAWCLLDSHQPSFFPISQARAAGHGAVPWVPDQPVLCVPPNGDEYGGVLQTGASREVDEELVHIVNKLRETNGRCVTNLMVSDIHASLQGKHKDYPYLSIFPIPAIKGRLDMLRAINFRVSQFLMFIGIGLQYKQHDWLSGIVIKAKSCLFLETKMNVWKKIWGESYSTERSSEVVSINRRVAFEARDMLRASAHKLQDDLSVYYPTVFVQLWRELSRTSPALLRRSDGKSWFTKFKGEPSIDDGGLYRETTATTCYELNNGLLPLFVPCSNGRHAQGLNQNTLVPSSSCVKWHECCQWLEFVGVLMGIATQNLEEVFPLQLAVPIWKLLVCEKLTPNDFQHFDVATAQTLRYLRETDFESEEMFAAIFPDQTFTCLNEQDEVVELVLNGESITVTLANREAYADALEHYRLHQFDEAVSYIRKGLQSIIQVDLLPMFTWSELELLVCGRPTLNLSLLRKKTEYSPDMDMHDTLVERFWRTLARFTSEEQQQFLQFVWGRSRLPFSEVDFGSYTFKLVRHMSPSNPDDYLPVAHTCFFQLELPNYSTDEIMRAKLLYAMNHCTSIVDEEQAAQQRDTTLWDS